MKGTNGGQENGLCFARSCFHAVFGGGHPPTVIFLTYLQTMMKGTDGGQENGLCFACSSFHAVFGGGRHMVFSEQAASKKKKLLVWFFPWSHLGTAILKLIALCSLRLHADLYI